MICIWSSIITRASYSRFVNNYQQTPNGTNLVDKIECHRTLPDLHLLALPVLAVILPNAADQLVQLASRLVLHPVLLAFQLRRSVQHYVLHLPLNVLYPRCQPRHLHNRQKKAYRNCDYCDWWLYCTFFLLFAAQRYILPCCTAFSKCLVSGQV